MLDVLERIQELQRELRACYREMGIDVDTDDDDDHYEADDGNATKTTIKVSETIIDDSEVSTSKRDSNDCRTKACDAVLVLCKRYSPDG